MKKKFTTVVSLLLTVVMLFSLSTSELSASAGINQSYETITIYFISYETIDTLYTNHTVNKSWTLSDNYVTYGDLIVKDDINLNGYSLTVYGDVNQSWGTVTINNGTLNVHGNYSMENSTKNNIGEIEYNDCNATLSMSHANDKVNIGGDLTTHNLEWGSGYSGRILLNAGTLTIGGNIWSDEGIGRYSNLSSGTNKVILNGAGDQSIYIKGGAFNQLEVINPQNRVITWSGNFEITKLTSDINVLSKELNLYSFDLNQNNMMIDGDVEIRGNIDLNGGCLTVKGNIIQPQGAIGINNGTLNVYGNYLFQNIATNNLREIEYNNCYASLIMDHPYDKVNINGDLITHNLSSSSSRMGVGGYYYDYGRIYLYKGTISIGGNIWSDSGLKISSGGNNTTILSGNKKQTVTLSSANKFDTLVLTMPISNYTITPDECWNTLIYIEDGSGDATF